MMNVLRSQRWVYSIGITFILLTALVVVNGDSNDFDDRDLQILPIPFDGLVNGSPDPCIFRRIIQAGSSECKHITLPTGLCQTCGVNIDIRPETGKYVNCLYLSGLEALDGTINHQCIDKLDEYMDMNPCDGFRRRGLRRYKRYIQPWFPDGALRRLRSPSRQVVDAFIYALCELPCDCIPQYNTDFTKPSVDITRGNCQGHALVDLCAVYPNIKLIQGQYSNLTLPSTPIDELPNICPYIKDWRSDNPGQWFGLTPTPVDSNVATFMNHVLDATELTHNQNVSSNQLWQQCFYLENTQKRIIPI